MNEVSCKVFGVLMRPLAAKRIALEDIVAGTAVTPERLHNRKERIDWDDYVTIMRNIRPHFTDEEYVELGRSYMRSPGLRFAFIVARMLFSPQDLYRWFCKPDKGVGAQMFANIIPVHREVSDHEIEIELTLPEGYAMCWDFYVISIGNFEEVPRLFGSPRARIRLVEIPHGGRFYIDVPRRRPLLPRMWRLVTWPFTARAAARELKDAHETLIERVAELEDARAKLDRQATQLRTAHKLNELAQRDLELAPMLQTISGALVGVAGFAWAELELGDGTHVSRTSGSSPTDPLRRTLTGRAGQAIAHLAVMPSHDADRAEREELLDFIAPGLALAIENAIYQTRLERLVDERTTELRQARDQLAGTVDQLREAQGARERFFGNISHEIRTPLSIIMLASSDIEARAGHLLDARTRSRFGVVTDSARKLVRLVDELLLLAAGQEGKLSTHPEPTDLAALVRQLEIAWRPAADRAQLSLTARTPEQLTANVDPVALERIATNLVSNAIKYTPPGGRVELLLEYDELGIRFSVFDTGAGIPAELAGKLFERFERGSVNAHIVGTGIGLSLAKQLVDAHGGTIAAHPRDGGGTELRVMLPASLALRDHAGRVATKLRLVDDRAQMPELLPAGTQVVPPGLSRGTLLLAEDDARLAEMIANLLADEFTVVIAHDGNAALELMLKYQPQLLVTDVDMPGLDGIELSRRFREQTGDRLAPIIILSAMLDLGTRVAGLEAGATDYVSKPFDPIELKSRVRAQFRARELALRLHRAEQLSSLGILTAGLAHELRNPANGIVNAIHPIRQMLPPELAAPDHPVSQLFDVMSECAEQINQLARQLLGFRENGLELEKRPIAVRDLIDRALALTQDALAGIDLEATLPESDHPLSCAPPLMLQVLINLIENAAYAAGRGGRVMLSAQLAGDRLMIEISDSGGGVPVELRERVFEPFFTTKPPGAGTGLGLSLSRDIVHRHGGTLDIRDRAGTATFVIELPAPHTIAAAG